MAENFLTIFLDEEKTKKVEEAGLGDQVVEIEGKKAVKIPLNKNEYKKICKGFPDAESGPEGTCVISDEAESTVMDFVAQLKTLDVMKAAIMKIYNPLAGKALRSKAS